MAHYKRKGHRGRSKQKAMDNQSCRCQGNSISKQSYRGRSKYAHVSSQQRNVVGADDE